MKENTVKILLIEDDEDDYVLTSELLAEVKSTRYEIDWVSKYADAMPALRSGCYDVCLIDYRLGEGNGIDLLREAAAAGCYTPMILLTGQGDKEIDIEATEAGAADYLVKGKIEAAVLERAIRYAKAKGRMLETMRESENRFRSVVESANDAIVLADFQGRIISWNKSAEMIFGYTFEEISGRPLSDLFPAGYYAASGDNNGADLLLASGLLHSDSRAVELNGLRKDGGEFPLEISLSSWKTAKGEFYSGIIRDVTERKSLEEQLTHQALHDPLTKLANRVLFRNRVEHALAKVNRQKTAVAVLFLDLDNFKTVNDSLGHAAGDILLVSVAERLRSALRNSDTPARLGGDEFAILLEDARHTADAVMIAERLKEILRAPFLIDGKEVFIGTSIGIAVTQTGDENPEELLRNADMAMYTAKTQGKGHYVVFETKMHEALMERIELETDLREAVENEQFVLHYQPIIDLQSERITGMEALVRWNHPVHGLIPPVKFISVAEETNLIIPLGKWILDEACRQAQAWQPHGSESGLSISVNLSTRQFQETTLVEMVKAALAESGLPPRCLILEITENLMLQNSEATIKKLRELRNLGVRLAIDDFGTGYSSLSHLQHFPIDILKIDKSFIDKISEGTEGIAMARAIIMMSDTLRLKTIAEGIEHPEQIIALQNLGCESGQGFHYAKPLTKEDMNEFLLRANSKEESGWLLSQIAPENLSGQNDLIIIS